LLLLRLLLSADVGNITVANNNVCYWILRLARVRLSFGEANLGLYRDARFAIPKDRRSRFTNLNPFLEVVLALTGCFYFQWL
jgi:hypothetical protein